MLTQRFSRLSLAASGVALTLYSAPAKADDLSDMRQEMQAMQRQYQAALTKLQHDYETKLQSMEKRLDAAENKATSGNAKSRRRAKDGGSGTERVGGLDANRRRHTGCA